MSDRDTLRAQIIDDFEESINESEDVPQDVADLFTGKRNAETFGDDDELIEDIKRSLSNGDDV